MNTLIDNFLNIDVFVASWPQLFRGFKMTLLLAIVIVPMGVGFGLAIAVVYSFKIRMLNWLLIFYTDLFRAFPPLVLLIFIYYGLPFVGFNLEAFAAVTLALTLNTASYFGEVFRAGIEGVPTGHVEAGRATGLNYPKTLRYIILPQAIRNMAPDIVSNILETIKLTALASVVTLPELLRMARIAQGNSFNTTPLVAAAVMYLIILWPLVRMVARMERKALAASR